MKFLPFAASVPLYFLSVATALFAAYRFFFMALGIRMMWMEPALYSTWAIVTVVAVTGIINLLLSAIAWGLWVLARILRSKGKSVLKLSQDVPLQPTNQP